MDYWSGTFKPSFLRSCIVVAIFKLAYSACYGIEWIRSVHAPRNESTTGMRAMRRLLRLGKTLATNTAPELRTMRQPFLAIVCRPSSKIQLVNIRHAPAPAAFSVKVNSSRYANSALAIVYVHGGGYVTGDVAGFFGIAEKVSNMFQCPVIMPQYRLAPECSIEDSVGDIVASLQHCVGDAVKDVFLMGDSAGAGLCVLTMRHVLATTRGISARIRGLVLFSPMLDLTCSSESFARFADTDPTFRPDLVKHCARLALRGGPATETNSPLCGSIEGFPPVYISVADDELLLDDSLRMAQRLSMHGVPCNLSCASHAFHAFPIMWPYAASADIELDKVYRWVRDADVNKEKMSALVDPVCMVQVASKHRNNKATRD